MKKKINQFTFLLQEPDKKFGSGFGTYGLAYHAKLYHNQEFEKLPVAKMLKFPEKQKNSQPKYLPRNAGKSFLSTTVC